MKHFRLRASCLVLFTLGACTIQPVSSGVLSDAQLLDEGLQAIASLAPPPYNLGAEAALKVLSDGISALQSGAKTPAQFAQVAETDVKQLATQLLTTTNANQSITQGVTIAENLAAAIVADVTPGMAGASGQDPRAAMRTWVAGANARRP